MKIEGQRVILHDDPRDSDSDDLFRWLNLEEWKYYDQPDQPFQPISREEFDKLFKKKSKEASSSSNSNGEYGTEPFSEAFVRIYDEPGRASNLEEWNRKRIRRDNAQRIKS
jgi:hypothetical protein